MKDFQVLFAHELQALLESLRRDLRAQDAAMLSNPDRADFHAWNARQVKRILEALNPRQAHRAKYDSPEMCVLSSEYA